MNNKEKIILELLNKLGETPEEVASSLEKQGIKGEPQMARSCPIANYLCQHNFCNMVCYDVIVDSVNCDLYIKSPNIIYQFIKRFDKNEFPNLVEK
jgi:hypothetical protein